MGSWPSALHTFFVHEIQRENFRVAFFLVRVEHETYQSALEHAAPVFEHYETGAGKFRRGLEIEYAQFLAYLPVGLGREIEFRVFPVLGDHLVVVGAFAWKGVVSSGMFGILNRKSSMFCSRVIR